MQHMTEEEQIQMAIEESLREGNGVTTQGTSTFSPHIDTFSDSQGNEVKSMAKSPRHTVSLAKFDLLQLVTPV